MAVLDPLKVVITNYPKEKEELLVAENNPEDMDAGFRDLPFSGEIYIEKDDFLEKADKNFYRLQLGHEVRLKNAYIIKANEVVKDKNGEIVEVHCTYDEDSRSGSGSEASMRRVKATIHWVSIKHALPAEVRLYDRLFTHEAPDANKEIDFKTYLNPDSLKVLHHAFVEPSLADVKPGDKFQFQRLGYFNVDDESTAKSLIFNRTVSLKDNWSKKGKKQ